VGFEKPQGKGLLKVSQEWQCEDGIFRGDVAGHFAFQLKDEGKSELGTRLFSHSSYQ
jgi:hypothetical protein